MNVTFEKIDAVNGLITVQLVEADYAEKVEKALKDFRKKANMPGFRPGQVPMGMLKKRFGTEIMVEQVNKMLGEQLYGYIREQKLNILGEPLPSENQEQIDFENQKDFTFKFDVALAPEFDAKLTAKDKVDYYTIEVTDEMVQKQVEMYASRAGQYSKVDEFQTRDMVKGLLAQLDAEGNTLEGGIQVEGATMLPDYFKNEDEKAKFNACHTNDVLVFNPSKAYDGNEVELNSLLKIEKDAVKDMTSDFSFQVEEITRYTPAAVDQNLFDQVLGEGAVKSEEEFRASIKETMVGEFVNDSDYKFMVDLRKYLEDRVGAVTYPDAMLKRIMRLNNQDKDEKYVEDNYEASVKELTWHLIKEQLSDQFELKVEQADVLETAKMVTKMQFAQYGMQNVPEEALTNYANQMLQNKQQAEGLVNRTVENKICAAAKALVKLNSKSVSLDEFNAMFQQ